MIGPEGQQDPHQLVDGPAQIAATIPVNAALVAVVIYVATARRFDPFDPWLRLIAGAALAQHAVALFYDASTARYHFLAWLLTLPVCLVWLQQVGIVWLQRRYPDLCLRIASQPLSLGLASGLARLHKVSS